MPSLSAPCSSSCAPASSWWSNPAAPAGADFQLEYGAPVYGLAPGRALLGALRLPCATPRIRTHCLRALRLSPPRLPLGLDADPAALFCYAGALL